MAEKFPLGTIVELIPEKCAALVRSEVTITYTSGGGSSTATTYSEQVEKVMPARILVRGTKKIQEFYSYEVGEKVILMTLKTNAHVTNTGRIINVENEWRDYADSYDNFYNVECLILGTYYEAPYNLPCRYDEVFMLQFKDGTSITYNLEDHELQIVCAGDISMTAKTIQLN